MRAVEERLADISARRDPLETLAAGVDFEISRPVVAKGRWEGGRPGCVTVPKFRLLLLQSLQGLPLEETEYMDGNRLSWMRFCEPGEGLIDRVNAAPDAWADSACRSSEDEEWLIEHGMTSRRRGKKPRGRPMPSGTRRTNGRKTAMRPKDEHVFAHQKDRMRLTVRTIGIACAGAAVTSANMSCEQLNRACVSRTGAAESSSMPTILVVLIRRDFRKQPAVWVVPFAGRAIPVGCSAGAACGIGVVPAGRRVGA